MRTDPSPRSEYKITYKHTTAMMSLTAVMLYELFKSIIIPLSASHFSLQAEDVMYSFVHTI